MKASVLISIGSVIHIDSGIPDLDACMTPPLFVTTKTLNSKKRNGMIETCA